jgi:hypothetical protein
MSQESRPISMSVAELKELAASVASEMKAAETVSPPLRERFISVRAALFQRGIYDPVLVRFDSATVAKAPAAEIATRLAEVAAAL